MKNEIENAKNPHPAAVAVERKSRFQWYEKQITESMTGVARIFRDMQKDPLKPWLETHPTFHEYVWGRWGIRKRRVQQMIEADTVKVLLCENNPEVAPILDDMKERPIRELGKVALDKQADVLQAAKTGAINGVVTGAVLAAAIAQVAPEAKLVAPPVVDLQPLTPKICPACHQPIP